MNRFNLTTTMTRARGWFTETIMTMNWNVKYLGDRKLKGFPQPQMRESSLLRVIAICRMMNSGYFMRRILIGFPFEFLV
jgi:hypothetical protein